MGELGGEQAAVTAWRKAAGRERRFCERDAVPWARLRRHALGIGQPRLDRDHASRLAAAEQLGANGPIPWRRSSQATRSSAGSGWRHRARSTREDSIPRRSAGSSAGSPAIGRGSQPPTPPRSRARWESQARVAGGLFAYLADGTPTKPMHPAWAAHGAHLASRLAANGAAGPQTVLEGKFGAVPRLPRRRGEARSTSPVSWRIWARAGRRPGSPTSRSPCAISCTAPLVRLPAPRRADLGRGRDRRRGSCPSRGPAVSLVLEPAEAEASAALRVRGQVLAAVLRRLDARSRPRLGR